MPNVTVNRLPPGGFGGLRGSGGSPVQRSGSAAGEGTGAAVCSTAPEDRLAYGFLSTHFVTARPESASSRREASRVRAA